MVILVYVTWKRFIPIPAIALLLKSFNIELEIVPLSLIYDTEDLSLPSTAAGAGWAGWCKLTYNSLETWEMQAKGCFKCPKGLLFDKLHWSCIVRPLRHIALMHCRFCKRQKQATGRYGRHLLNDILRFLVGELAAVWHKLWSVKQSSETSCNVCADDSSDFRYSIQKTVGSVYLKIEKDRCKIAAERKGTRTRPVQ